MSGPPPGSLAVATGPVVAAIDVGSSAVRLSVAQRAPDGTLRTLAQQRLPVRLGRDVFAHGGGGEVGPALQRELLAALGRLQQLAGRHRAVRLRAVGTSALREARNAAAVCARVQATLGLTLEVLGGDEEATLSRLALAAALAAQGCDVPPARRLYVDLGGGSLELADAEARFVTSLPLGTVRLLAAEPRLQEAAGVDGAAVAAHYAAVQARLRVACAPHARALAPPEAGPWVLVGTGGNLEVMAQLAPAAAGTPGRQVALHALGPLAERVAAVPLAERAQKLGLRPDRADLALPALLVVRALAAHTAAAALWVPGSGLRDGLLAQLADDAHAATATGAPGR